MDSGLIGKAIGLGSALKEIGWDVLDLQDIKIWNRNFQGDTLAS